MNVEIDLSELDEDKTKKKECIILLERAIQLKRVIIERKYKISIILSFCLKSNKKNKKIQRIDTQEF